MKTVSTESEILANVQKMESVREAGVNSQNYEYYRGLIARGRCFYPYSVNGVLYFAPSRFIGYRNVTFKKHRTAVDLDGKLTNPAISTALKVPLVEDAGLDASYGHFISVVLGYSGPIHNVRRKYWLTDAAVEFVRSVPEEEQEIPGLTDTEREALVRARVGQNNFRKALIRKWKGCPVTGCSLIEVLRASHIMPWSVSTNEQRLDPNNGLLLTPNLDMLFDAGYITFGDSGGLVCSGRFSKSERKVLLPSGIKDIPLNEAHKTYLAYHRKHVFKG